MPHRSRAAAPAAGAVLAALLLAGCASGSATRPARPLTSPTGTTATRATTSAPVTSVSVTTPPVTTPPVTTPPTSPRSTPTASPLPLRFATGDASQVITVVAPSASSTTATLQAWERGSDGWAAYGPAVPAHLGSDGLSTRASEDRSATPIGSFTLTEAFGARSNPGTSLPYRHTDTSDWWISEPGDLYNTRQRCATTANTCAFTRGAPNEHLYSETPAYDYAVVIDYNSADAPGGVHAGAGSAFFLHVSEGRPTAGCVSVPRSQLLRVLRWLTPARHPRILIGL